MFVCVVLYICVACVLYRCFIVVFACGVFKYIWYSLIWYSFLFLRCMVVHSMMYRLRLILAASYMQLGQKAFGETAGFYITEITIILFLLGALTGYVIIIGLYYCWAYRR